MTSLSLIDSHISPLGQKRKYTGKQSRMLEPDNEVEEAEDPITTKYSKKRQRVLDSDSEQSSDGFMSTPGPLLPVARFNVIPTGIPAAKEPQDLNSFSEVESDASISHITPTEPTFNQILKSPLQLACSPQHPQELACQSYSVVENCILPPEQVQAEEFASSTLKCEG